MTKKKRRDTPEWQWEQALIDAYSDYRWREVFDELHAQLHRWERGEITHDEMDNVVHETHKQTQETYKALYYPKRDELILYSQFNEAWFTQWVADHPPPAGIDLSPARRIREDFARFDQHATKQEEDEAR